MRPNATLLFLAAYSLVVPPLLAQNRDVNYDESKIGPITLPDPLVRANGAKVADARDWTQRRRPEILERFTTQVYGRSPARPRDMKFQLLAEDKAALNGKATRKEIRILFTGKKDGPHMDLLLYIPNAVKGKVPAFLGLNFSGNQAVSMDPGVRLSDGWFRGGRDSGVTNNRATEASRGIEASRWVVEKVIDRGFALATAYYGDIEPDHPEGWKNGVRAALSEDGAQTEFKPDEWGAISAWAWGLSRALDCLEKEKRIDATKVAVLGHSRLGKTALWAGASDQRFAIVISNDSGEGGAALARRNFGETTAIINRSFPHWFCGNFKQYGGHEENLPVDQHMLIALVGPRPVYVASAEEDKWADPKGEFLAAKNAEPVYRLFARAGLCVEDMPPVNKPVGDFIGYHIRTGKHDVTEYDWQQYLDFATRHFRSGK
jgi:hypothetical protein